MAAAPRKNIRFYQISLIFLFFRQASCFTPSSSSFNERRSVDVAPTTSRTPTALRVATSPTNPLEQEQHEEEDHAALLKRTAAQLERLKRQELYNGGEADTDFSMMYEKYLRQPANSLKQELKVRNLPGKGRKPDLARRLADYDVKVAQRGGAMDDDGEENITTWNPEESAAATRQKVDDERASRSNLPLKTFCGLDLSSAASQALGKANFQTPSPIQKFAIPSLTSRESLILHAETGSGKTLAYLLPLTEQLWKEYDQDMLEDAGYGFILTPTRELAAQVAGVATVLAPPGSVRMVSRATNLRNDGLRDLGEERHGGILDKGDGRTTPRLFIGSAKAIMHSLYGTSKMPASPTRKPDSMFLLQNTRWVVLDEVDRLLIQSSSRHEKPAAVVTSAVARLSLGKAQVIAASATVGRSLKRELSRVLGLEPRECPRVVCANNNNNEESHQGNNKAQDSKGRHVGRAVKIPDTVQHFVTQVDTTSVGKLLTNAVYVLRALRNKNTNRKVLFVLTKKCGINTQNAIGALKHFGCQPEPQSLLDALEADGTNQMIEVHRQVSGATGIGESSYFGDTSQDGEADSDANQEGYLLVTGEDSVRGLHLDGLDVVVVVGRANGPDEYTHIAGRTGRAGRPGKVISVLGKKDAAALNGWERMLDVQFDAVDTDGIAEFE